MYRSEHDTPLLERPTPQGYAAGQAATAAGDNGDATNFAHDERGTAKQASFLIVLLRALSAWHA